MFKMEFREFFQIDEIVDFAKRDSGGIDLRVSNQFLDGIEEECRRKSLNQAELKSCIEEKLSLIKDKDYEGVFFVNGSEYKVYLDYLHSKNLMDSSFVHFLISLGASAEEVRGYLQNVYAVSFTGPQGYKTTKLMRGAAEVYSKVLLTIKKLSEERPVEGLAFSSYESGMDLVYDRFLKRFTDFEIVDKGSVDLYLSQSLIERIIVQYPSLDRYLGQLVGVHNSKLQVTRQSKVRDRDYNLRIRPLIGKIVVYKGRMGSGVGLVDSYERGGLNLYHIYLNRLERIWRKFEEIYQVGDYPNLVGEVERLQDQVGSLVRSGVPLGNYLGKLGDYEPYVGVFPWEGSNSV